MYYSGDLAHANLWEKSYLDTASYPEGYCNDGPIEEDTSGLGPELDQQALCVCQWGGSGQHSSGDYRCTYDWPPPYLDDVEDFPEGYPIPESSETTTGTDPTGGPEERFFVCSDDARETCVEIWEVPDLPDPPFEVAKYCWIDPLEDAGKVPCEWKTDATLADGPCEDRCNALRISIQGQVDAHNDVPNSIPWELRDGDGNALDTGEPNCSLTPREMTATDVCSTTDQYLTVWGGVSTLTPVQTTISLTTTGGSTGSTAVSGIVGYEVSNCSGGRGHDRQRAGRSGGRDPARKPGRGLVQKRPPDAEHGGKLAGRSVQRHLPDQLAPLAGPMSSGKAQTARPDLPSLRRLTCAVVALGACEPESDLVHQGGEYVDYRHSPSLEPCAGTAKYLDDFVPFLADELGVAPPSHMTYSWLDATDYAETSCWDFLGCYRDGHALSARPFLLHELVHGFDLGRNFHTWKFFSEGLAATYDPWDSDAIGPLYLLTPVEGDPLPDPRPTMTLVDLTKRDYFIAGAFVVFLLTHHGPEAFAEFTRNLGPERDMDALRQVFRAAFSVELDDEAERFMARTDCPDDAYPVRVYDCAAPEVPWVDSTLWQLETTMDCTDESVAGGFSPEEGAWPTIRSFTLEVPVTGDYSFAATGDPDVVVQLAPCFGCRWDLRSAETTTGLAIDTKLHAGKYYARIRGPRASRSPKVSISVQKHPP